VLSQRALRQHERRSQCDHAASSVISSGRAGPTRADRAAVATMMSMTRSAPPLPADEPPACSAGLGCGGGGVVRAGRLGKRAVVEPPVTADNEAAWAVGACPWCPQLGGALSRYSGDQLEAAWPPMPKGVEDGAADVWEPLLGIAVAAGGDGPARARVAVVALASQAIYGGPRPSASACSPTWEARSPSAGAHAWHSEALLALLHRQTGNHGVILTASRWTLAPAAQNS
jgi:hypothetical protein